jgi:hypothetical protein
MVTLREWFLRQLTKARELDPSLAQEPRRANVVATPRELEAMVRLGLIDSAQETHRKLVAEEIEKLAAAGDAGSKLDIGSLSACFWRFRPAPATR